MGGLDSDRGGAGQPVDALPAPLHPPPHSLSPSRSHVGVERPGLVAYRVELGEKVRKGQPVADLIALDGPEAFMARTPILAGTDGFVLSRVSDKYVQRGGSIMKIVGTTPLPGRKGAYLLED